MRCGEYYHNNLLNNNLTRASDRMGIVVFAGESYTQCPLTTDTRPLIS